MNNTIWLCNIRSADEKHYEEHEVVDGNRDGAIYSLRDGAFERLRETRVIEPMDFFPNWYEGTQIPMSEVRSSVKYILYRLLMKVAHKCNWHYAPPVYPDGDTQLWCKWCGFRQTIKRSGES